MQHSFKQLMQLGTNKIEQEHAPLRAYPQSQKDKADIKYVGNISGSTPVALLVCGITQNLPDWFQQPLVGRWGTGQGRTHQMLVCLQESLLTSLYVARFWLISQ